MQGGVCVLYTWLIQRSVVVDTMTCTQYIHGLEFEWRCEIVVW